jgi:hypothetical protein
MSLSKRSLVSCALAVVVGLTVSVSAQPAASYKSGADFYLAYRGAFTKAKTIEELVPWMSKERASEIAKTPAGERKEMFEMVKMMDDHTNIKVIKETPTAKGADLQVEAMSGGGKSKSTGVITLVKEGAAWKVDQESWKGGM